MALPGFLKSKAAREAAKKKAAEERTEFEKRIRRSVWAELQPQRECLKYIKDERQKKAEIERLNNMVEARVQCGLKARFGR